MQTPIMIRRGDVSDAELLMRSYGKAAGLEAAERAEQSRGLGNHISFCRWRQIERLILFLSTPRSGGTVH